MISALTRAVEDRQFVRGYVRHAELIDFTQTGAFLKTAGAQAAPARVGARRSVDTPGHVLVEAVSEGVFRVRYSLGESVRDCDPRLLQLTLPPVPFSSTERTDEGLVLQTDTASLHVRFRPLEMELRHADGRTLAVVGGREKNWYRIWDTHATGIGTTLDGALPIATECFGLRPQEAVYGFGERFTRLNKVGQTVEVNMEEAVGTITPRSYKNVPFFVSTAGYGVFFATADPMTAWVGSMSAADIQVAVADEALDYWLIAGDIPTVLDRYGAITGRSPVPPAWSFGYWQSKISYKAADEALAVVDRMRGAGVPIDVLHLDTHWFSTDWFCDLEFAPDRFPDPRKFFDEMRERGVRVSLWQLPYIPKGCQLFDDLAAVDGFVKTDDGSMYDIGILYETNDDGVIVPSRSGTPVGCIDFTNPAAVEVHQNYLRRLFDLGASVIKVDFGEQAPTSGSYSDGTPGRAAHNLYPLLYGTAVADVTEAATGDRIVWARSAWAGSQRNPLHWGGDSSSNWWNLGPQFAGGLSFGMSGFAFWSQDIGGFLGQPDGELLIRWMQAGLFLSHSRIHGFGTRELYEFEGDVFEISRDFIRLRYSLLPYLLRSAAECAAVTRPMAAPLVFDFQDDPSTWNVDDQWMLGRDLLVAPVFVEGGRRRVYLPRGTWTDWWTDEVLGGGRWVDIEVPLDQMPLYIREGAEIEMCEPMDYVGQRPTDIATVRRGAILP